jgi:hypothetical protein
MIDRSRKPDRSGRSSGAVAPGSSRESRSDPHSPVGPPKIDSSESDRSSESTDRVGSTSDDEANGFARTLLDLIQSLPRRPVESARGIIGSTSDAIIGPVTPVFEEQFSVGRRVEGEDSVREGDFPISSSLGPPAPVGDEAASGGTGGADRREEIAPLPLSAMLCGSAHEEPAETLIANRREPNEGSFTDPALSADRVSGVESSGARAVKPTHSPVADTSSDILAAAAIAGNVELHTGPDPWTSCRDGVASELTMRGAASSVRMPPETVAVGPVGPVAGHDEVFGRTTAESSFATSWSESSGADLLSSRPGAASPADEGSAGVDLNPTNALLGQILDELRRHHQSAPLASGRSVYPER